MPPEQDGSRDRARPFPAFEGNRDRGIPRRRHGKHSTKSEIKKCHRGDQAFGPGRLCFDCIA